MVVPSFGKAGASVSAKFGPDMEGSGMSAGFTFVYSCREAFPSRTSVRFCMKEAAPSSVTASEEKKEEMSCVMSSTEERISPSPAL